jgi:cysteinyl-tRNA synthetase
VDINNEKMSKSLGNFTMIKEVLENYSPEVIRMFLLSKHYRSPIDYSEDSMKEVAMGLDRIYAFLERLEKAGVQHDSSPIQSLTQKLSKNLTGKLWDEFRAAMNDDFNSAKAVGLIFEAVKKGNKLLDDALNNLSEENLETLNCVYSDIKSISHVLGIFLLEPEAWFKAKKEKGMEGITLEPDQIEDLIQQRTDARKNKDFTLADEIRDNLQKKNIILKDGPTGTTWRFEYSSNCFLNYLIIFQRRRVLIFLWFPMRYTHQ